MQELKYCVLKVSIYSKIYFLFFYTKMNLFQVLLLIHLQIYLHVKTINVVFCNVILMGEVGDDSSDVWCYENMAFAIKIALSKCRVG